jgi:hypothetical protein
VLVFGEMNVDGFFLECDLQRAGSFEPLLQSKDELERRICEYDSSGPPSQLTIRSEAQVQLVRGRRTAGPP